ncbi:hypothetical protein M8J77_012391 [Diaphorina citri]|nr:hypothetical protein M8J77_012391 [Diaphorina citri]
MKAVTCGAHHTSGLMASKPSTFVIWVSKHVPSCTSRSGITDMSASMDPYNYFQTPFHSIHQLSTVSTARMLLRRSHSHYLQTTIQIDSEKLKENKIHYNENEVRLETKDIFTIIVMVAIS